MSSKDKYCGIGKSNKKLGTAEECLDNKQVRQYGIKAISPKILENKKIKDSKLKLNRDLREATVGLRGMTKTATNIIKEKERINTTKYLKEKIAMYDTEKEKQMVEKLVLRRRKEVDEEISILKNKLQRQLNKIQELTNLIEQS